ncbi:hypothetical protein C8D76_11146 [Pasteurella langaaensis DSM 22999]|uniref:Lipoprotein n=1 Tax=Alitibacter langaaensis DSM 22999 TaxID=1122935 RepID=A0A2U0SN23_9PAST|nr:hypothetical protein [Pasteurella langaaensis]PVX32732.1 hypothetical protein C8D76_11146 [Pasteurella langaaensis DSM 22999]
MNKLKLLIVVAIASKLFACTSQKTANKKLGYLKTDISSAELQNPTLYKRYYYSCSNYETGSDSYLSTYFPLSRESRMKENFGIYFQLDGGKAEPFDHIANVPLNAQGSRFEVIYRSYQQINGAYVDLIARELSSTYYKNINGTRVPWLECREG